MNNDFPYTPQPVLKDDQLYVGDRYETFCGKHAGITARYTGRDLSGHKVIKARPSEVKAYALYCETCRALERQGQA